MNTLKLFIKLCFILSFTLLNANSIEKKTNKKIVYIPIDNGIPFWQIMSKGISVIATHKKYDFEVLDAENSPKKELELTIKAIKEKVSGIIISPSNSSAAVTILEIAKNANIPVVIADIGSDGGEYVSYISSDNITGAYNLGLHLTRKMKEKGWQKGKVGIIAIPQKRINGQQRTQGFMSALRQENIKGAGIKQMVKWTEEETYQFTKDFIMNCPDVKAIWLQTSNVYKGALRAIKELKKEKEIFLVTFDAEPEFIELIKDNTIIGSAMQQPFIIGEVAAKTLLKHIEGEKVKKNIQIPILTVNKYNIMENLITIEQNVLGIE